MPEIRTFAGNYRFLSNFYPCAVVLDDRIYPSVENAYQAAKCADTDQQMQFQFASAARAKQLGRRVRIRPDWESVKGTIMADLLVQKFRWPDLRAQLLATDDATLVEGNWWHDTYWGVCDGVGENRLGQLLMWVRALCRAEQDARLYDVPRTLVLPAKMGRQ